MADQAIERPPPTRQCGRCREVFVDREVDLDAEPSLVVAEWWVCDACRDSLLPGGRTTGTRRG